MVDLFHDMTQFLNGNIAQSFAFAVQMFVDLDGRFLHDSMGFLGAAGEEKIGAAGNPLLTIIGVESQA